MPVIFQQNTGKVVAVSDKVAEGSFSLGNITSDKITYAGHKSIITRIGIAAAGTFSFYTPLATTFTYMFLAIVWVKFSYTE